jgi:hypothetical protein
MRKVIITLVLSGAAIFTTLHATVRQSPGVDSRCFELRTYTATPGKLDALSARFRDQIIPLFDKHKMSVVAFWIPTDKADTLVYLLAFPSRAAADASWAAFRADPAWAAIQKATQADGPMTVKVESMFMNPTGYSPLK